MKHLQIDVDKLLRERVPGVYRWLPRGLISLVERMICQDELNRQLLINAGKTGADFCRGVIEDLGVKYSVEGTEHLPEKGDCRKIFVCNHPLGGLDGMIMIDWLSRVYDTKVYFVVNDLLRVVQPLEDVFLPVNKHGRQSRAEAAKIDEAFDSSSPIIMFPAGLVSRRGKEGIADLTWNKMFVNRAIRHQRDVVPVFFSGHNSRFFYNFARLRVALGIKFNYEMICLPSEVFKSRGKNFGLAVGEPLSWSSLEGGTGAMTTAARVKAMVYSMEKKCVL